MAKLAEDVIIEILVKLPVKSLLRFRCVCKSWCHLIKSSKFIDMHLEYHNTDDIILVLRKFEHAKKHFASLHSYESLDIISPCFQIPFETYTIQVCEPRNGLLCISFSLGETIVLCNPVMREFKVLPSRPFPCPDGWNGNSIKVIGFGFDSTKKDYKVVTIVTYRKLIGTIYNFTKECDIYNLSSTSWRKIECGNFPCVYNTLGSGTQLNGSLHWLAYREYIDCMLVFNVTTEVFQEMAFPDLDLGERNFLTVLNESLVLFTCEEPFYPDPLEQKSVDIWVMRQYGVAESWTKQATVGPVTGIPHLFLLWKNEAMISENDEGQLVSCTLDTNEINTFEIQGHPGSLIFMVYQETLVSIK